MAGEAARIAALLATAGIRVAASIPGDGRFAKIAGAHRARVAVSHCLQALGDFAEGLAERFGIPNVAASFYGAANVSAALRAIAARLVERGAPSDLLIRTESAIDAHEVDLFKRLAPLRRLLTGRRALLITGGIKTWSLAATLQDLGIAVAGVTTHKTSEIDREQLRRILAPDAMLLDGIPAGKLRQLLRERAIDVVLGGGSGRFEVAAAGVPWVEINHERRQALTGYDGVVNLATTISDALEHPIWASVRLAAPW